MLTFSVGKTSRNKVQWSTSYIVQKAGAAVYY